MVLGHLMNGSVRALNRQLHQVFDVGAVRLMTKRFIEHFNRSLRSDFAGFRAADAVGNGKNAAFAVGEKRIFIERTLLVQTAIGDGRGFQRSRTACLAGCAVIGLAHSTASSFNDERGSLPGPLASIAVARIAMGKGHQHSQHGKAGDQTKSAVTHKRQSDSGHRQSSQDASDIDERLKTDKGRQAGRAKFGKHITRIERSTNTSDHKNDNGQNDYRAATQAFLLGQGGVDIIGVGDRNHFGIAEPETAARVFAGSDAENRLRRLKGKLVKPDINVDDLLHRRTLFGKFLQLADPC